MAKVEYSPLALEDLQCIRDYILANFGESVAKKILKKLTSSILSLEQHPLLGVDFGKIIDLQTEYRYLFLENNYIFYRLEADSIKIIRVLNERQDYMQQLFGISEKVV